MYFAKLTLCLIVTNFYNFKTFWALFSLLPNVQACLTLIPLTLAIVQTKGVHKVHTLMLDLVVNSSQNQVHQCILQKLNLGPKKVFKTGQRIWRNARTNISPRAFIINIFTAVIITVMNKLV